MLRLVIDTNIWLDLLVFEDPRVQALREGLEQGRYHAIGTHAMRSELAVVVARPQFKQDEAQQQAALARWAELTEQVEVAPAYNLSCRDPDDRKFLDLAVAHRVDWLLSKDRALLAARKFALRRFGLNIGTLEQMLAAEAAQAAEVARASGTDHATQAVAATEATPRPEKTRTAETAGAAGVAGVPGVART